MKYLYQFCIIAAVSFAGELCKLLLPFPVPASVYGLLLLFILLYTKVIKVEQIEETANFFLKIMPALFIPASVSLITVFAALISNIAALMIIIAVSTIVVMLVTGITAQAIIRLKRKRIK